MDKKELLALRSQSHALKPVVIIGANGLTKAVHQEIEVALDSHELIKVRINAQDKDERNKIISAICQEQGALKINQVGHIVAIYRKCEE